MSIRKAQEEVLQDEIDLMTVLEWAAKNFTAETALGNQICHEWCGTFVHYRKANKTDIQGAQEDFDKGLADEREQLNAFLKVTVPKHHGGWDTLFNQEKGIIAALADLK